MLVGGLAIKLEAATDVREDLERRILQLPQNVTVAARMLSDGLLPGSGQPRPTPPSAA